MINLVKKENLNLSILETDFDIFSDIVNTFTSENIKKECLIDLDNYVIPEFFKNKVTLVLQTNGMLIGYLSFSFKIMGNMSQAKIEKLYISSSFLEKQMEVTLIEGAIYIAGEVSARNVVVTCDEHDKESFMLYRSLGFYEVGMNEDGSVLSLNTTTCVSNRKLNEKFRNIAPDYLDYKNIKLVKKIAEGRTGKIYVTADGQILKMFSSTSFLEIKGKEETLKFLKELNLPEVVKPKALVYYEGIFVGYVMEYLPDGQVLSNLQNENYSFEEKIEKIKAVESVMKKLHALNIFVCDLNPDNIFFDKNNNVKLIDCDAFVVKNNVINNEIDIKYRDPINKIVSAKTDMYAFAITALQIFMGIKFDNSSTSEDIKKIYDKNISKLPISFKNYYNHIFNSDERIYLSDSYERYLSDMYNPEHLNTIDDNKSGKISMIILSLIAVIITISLLVYIKFIR